VYLAPSDHHLTITPGHTFAFQNGPRVSHTRSAVDPLFASAAAVYGNRTIAIVLTGGGTDGVRGSCAVRAAGGTVVAQDPDDAAHPGMPTAAVKSGAAGYVLPLDSIADALTALVQTGHYEPEPERGFVPP
jgi:two-component system chemotaxis response regulator CheB